MQKYEIYNISLRFILDGNYSAIVWRKREKKERRRERKKEKA